MEFNGLTEGQKAKARACKMLALAREEGYGPTDAELQAVSVASWYHCSADCRSDCRVPYGS